MLALHESVVSQPWTDARDIQTLQMIQMLKSEYDANQSCLAHLHLWIGGLEKLLRKIGHVRLIPYMHNFCMDTQDYPLVMAHEYILEHRHLVTPQLEYLLVESERMNSLWENNSTTDADLYEWAIHLKKLLWVMQRHENYHLRINIEFFTCYADVHRELDGHKREE
jgi:hypothetical protein